MIAPGGTFYFYEKSAWFSKIAAEKSDDFNVCHPSPCIRVALARFT